GKSAPTGAPRPCALVVDDDPLVRRSVARHLGADFDVRDAGTTQSALAILEELSRVDLALVDYELPDGNGVPILERLRFWPDSVRVLMSGDPQGISELRKSGKLVPIVLAKPLCWASVES